jgi:hypothetical protein
LTTAIRRSLHRFPLCSIVVTASRQSPPQERPRQIEPFGAGSSPNNPGRIPPPIVDNLFAVRGALAAQHLTVDAPADAPIEEGKPYVDGNGSLPAGSDVSYSNKSFVRY